ncbi:uncharacterized protein G2W53_018529 [Senna tora]|uniref:Uncharacterized protein n=1 Tax=Senna tora TaxID=362788 RepID=A0A834TW30_9FABA|nr:uncharacterized protein G2W53_018529 [Senna tora]
MACLPDHPICAYAPRETYLSLIHYGDIETTLCTLRYGCRNKQAEDGMLQNQVEHRKETQEAFQYLYQNQLQMATMDLITLGDPQRTSYQNNPQLQLHHHYLQISLEVLGRGMA